jgi:hypothetical protein
VDVAGPLGGIINLEGNAAQTVADFTGTADNTPIINMGTTDDIILGSSVIPAPSAGSSVVLNYDTTAGTLSVTDTDSTGGVATTYLTIGGVAGNSLTTASFVETNGPAGLTIQLAQGFTFSTSAGTGAFENATDYVQGVAPPDSLTPVDQVTIALGTAQISAAPVNDEGIITVASGAALDVDNSLTGGGTLAVDGSLYETANISFAGTISINGLAEVQGGTLIADNAINGSGVLEVQSFAAATLVAGSDVALSNYGSIDLTGSLSGTTVDMEGTLSATGSQLTDAGTYDPTAKSFAATADVTNFAAGDTISISGTNDPSGLSTDIFTNTVYSGGVLSFLDSTTGQTFSVNVTAPDLADTYHGSDFTLTGGNGYVDITTDIPCFAAGTRILAADGEVLVEDIQVGDELVTVRHDAITSRKVVWTGRRAIDISRHPRPEMVRPVRIIAGAFGDNLPERDLRLSPLHAVYVNGCLFEAISLVNGTTTYQEQATKHVTYHHIELEAHDVILAEGLAAESFLDTGDRNMFETVSGVMVLHPDFATPEGAVFCAPMVREGEALAQVRAELNDRAAGQVRKLA